MVSPLKMKLPDLSQRIRGAQSHSEYKNRLRQMSDDQLKAEQARLEARVADASAGPVRDEDAVKRAQAQLAEVTEELKARQAISSSSDPKYAQDVHRMSGSELATERLRQQERLREATTGANRDPEVAADARAKLETLGVESKARTRDAFQDFTTGGLPQDERSTPISPLSRKLYEARLGNMSVEELDAEKARQQAALKDATQGPHRDPVKAANARARLELIDAALEKRLGTTAGYSERLRGLSDEELAAEKTAKQAELKDAQMGRHRDPDAASRAQAELDQIAAEEKARVEIKESDDPAYAQRVHTLDDAELKAERKAQEERLREASSGASRDPEAARDAQDKLVAIGVESARRRNGVLQGDLPEDPDTRPLTEAQLDAYSGRLRGQSDEELMAMREKLVKRQQDAAGGANQDPVVVKNVEARLARLDAELKLREELKAGPQPEYALKTHQLSDRELRKEIAAQQERLREATSGSFQDPEAAADAKQKLQLLREESSRRNPISDTITALRSRDRIAV